ncbi:PAS domain S-box protein [Sphingomonas sp. TDK1]|uniref:PAS domain S-box protein n=1 Tax=Sphingomonas sp. TDK1 TaxID=453247 RepID=UPI0007D9651A|nr:PAS domain S-box protein [Sphingomonas sp. TDK1]OAN62288.1 hybrid sensor histidine kinase/response regulator [Sphingomonas sp. TDK1]
MTDVSTLSPPAASMPAFLLGGGDCARAIAAKDWTDTPLGPVEDWAECFKTTIAIMLRSAVPIVMLWGEDGVLLYNDAYSGFAGHRHPMLLGAKVRDAWPEAVDFNAHVMEVGLAGGTLHYRDQELTLDRHGRPEQVWMNMDFSPAIDANGDPVGVICFLAETTERVAAERRSDFLLALADALRPLTTPADIMRVAADRLGAHLRASRVFYAEIASGWMTVERDFSDGVSSIVGEHSLEAFGPDLLSAYRMGTPIVMRDVPGDQRLNEEARAGLCSRQVGAFIDVVLFQDDHQVGLLAVQSATPRDWTASEQSLVEEAAERVKVAVERARAERDRLWTLSQDMLARADFDGMMSAVSPAWTTILGWSENALLTRGYATFMHPDDMAATLVAIEGMRASRLPTRFENRIATKDGEWKSIEWTVAPEPDGRNFVAVGRDLSEAKAREAELRLAQEALRQSQKMEAMGSLTGGVAHDFNNLLTPIIGSLDLLVRKQLGSDREQRLIEGALQSAERAKTLVQRLLAFARRQPLQATAVDVVQLVEGMASLIEATLGPTIAVRVDLDRAMPPAKADLNQLEMAVLNLAVNARDAMPDGGELLLKAHRESVRDGHASGLPRGHYIRLSVGDTGIGMDADTMERAAEPFFSTKGVGRGTGLGLSMVHGLTAQLGGRLAIDSAPGRGTTITLWLPISATAVLEDPVQTPPAAKDKGMGLALLLEDEELVRMSTAHMLSDLGYDVVEAASAEEALRLIGEGLTPDLVVTDHLMPGMSGVQLARTLKADRPQLPVLIVSGYAEEEGMDPDLPRLTKPFRSAELAGSLSALSCLPAGA